jgi:hypothetical protein
MGQIAAKSFLKSNWGTLKNKKVYLLVVGVSPEGADDSWQQYQMIPEHIRQGLSGYKKVTGMIDMDKLNFFFRRIMRIAQEKGAVTSGGLNREQVEPVIEWLRTATN